ncbi:MAG: FeoB small GTPase domain-containing protein [Peptostreptococcaceae bacterium]
MDSSNTFFHLYNCKVKNLIALTGCSHFDNSFIFNKLLNLSNFNICNDLFLPNINIYYNSIDYNIVNLPATSSLLDLPHNKIITRDFICFANPKCIIVTSNEDNLEKNLNLLFQIMEINKRIVFCINTLDSNKNTVLDIDLLESELGIPVLLYRDNNIDLELLLNLLEDTIFNKPTYKVKYSLYDCNIESVLTSFNPILRQSIDGINPRWLALRIIDNDQSFFSSMSIYLDESCVTKINTIKDSFPKTLDPTRVRSNFNKRTYDYSISLKNKVSFSQNNNSNLLSKNIIKYLFLLTIILLSLIYYIFLLFL